MDVITWSRLAQPQTYLWFSRQQVQPRLLFQQQGQSLIEALILATLFAAFWLLPIATKQQNLIVMFEQIIDHTTIHFEWMWSQFLLNPLVV